MFERVEGVVKYGGGRDKWKESEYFMTDLLRAFRIRKNGSRDKNLNWANGIMDLPSVVI